MEQNDFVQLQLRSYSSLRVLYAVASYCTTFLGFRDEKTFVLIKRKAIVETPFHIVRVAVMLTQRILVISTRPIRSGKIVV